MSQPNYDPRYLEGIKHFNRGHFFESHEVWEDLWRDEQGPPRLFYKGLIQAAVALYHLTQGNHRGAETLLARSKSYLGRYPPVYQGIDVAGLLDSLARLFAEIGPGRPLAPTMSPSNFPTLHLNPEP